MSHQTSKIGRRHFIGQSSCAAVGATSFLSTLTNLLFTKAAAAHATTAADEYKALICLYLPGGNDSFNMLVPTGNDYNEYKTVRTDLAIPKNSLLPISPVNNVGKQLALHPGMTGLKTLFDAGKLSFISNVGSLIRPTTLNDYYNDNYLPYGLFSHSDQTEQWQTSIPSERSALGWGGRVADMLVTENSPSNVSMNISLGGNNLFQLGSKVFPYTVNWYGAVQLDGYNGEWGYDPIRKLAVDNQMALEYKNILEKNFVGIKKTSMDAYVEFTEATDNSLPPDNMGEEDLAKSLRQIAHIIKGRNKLGVKKQIFYVQWGGWDFHDDVIGNMEYMMPILSDTLKAFYDLLVDMGVHENVVLFSASEFGRSLTSNAAGSDHAWGGNQFVMGGRIKGKQVFGKYPDLYLENPLDTGRGSLIPTTSVDQMCAELAMWLGVSRADIPVIFPNLKNFYNIQGNEPPIGFVL
jgi:uncharacterized protein (DUF1501 family)